MIRLILEILDDFMGLLEAVDNWKVKMASILLSIQHQNLSHQFIILWYYPSWINCKWFYCNYNRLTVFYLTNTSRVVHIVLYYLYSLFVELFPYKIESYLNLCHTVPHLEIIIYFRFFKVPDFIRYRHSFVMVWCQHNYQSVLLPISHLLPENSLKS